MKCAFIIALIVFGLVFIFNGQNMAGAVDAGATWGFVVSLIVCIVMVCSIVFPALIGAILGGLAGLFAGKEVVGTGGGAAGGILGFLVGGLGGGALTGWMIVFPLAVSIISCAGFHYLNEWGISGLEDDAVRNTALILLGISCVITYLHKKK